MRAVTIALITVVAAATPLVGACSASKSAATHTPSGAAASVTTQASTPPATPPTSSSPPSTSAAAGALTGGWSGSYSGAYSGTFTLTWTQTGSALAGTINLSSAGTEPLTGTVNGDKITFGAVGSAAISYTGTVSGSSMSGSYTIAGGAGGTGSWSAHRG